MVVVVLNGAALGQLERSGRKKLLVLLGLRLAASKIVHNLPKLVAIAIAFSVAYGQSH